MSTSADLALELRAQRAFYETVLQALDDAGQAFSLIEPGGRIVEVNEAWERISGRSAEELLALHSWTTLVPEPDRERVAAEVAARADGSRSREPLEALLLRPDGSLVHVEATVVAVDVAGEPRLAVLARDVSQREDAEQRLRYQRGLLEAQAESTMDGILIVSPDGRMISHNRRFAELWDFPEEIIAAGVDDHALDAALDRVADPEAFITRVRELYDHPEEAARDELVMRDGRVLDRYGAPVVDADGSYHGWIWSFRDVTAEKRAEDRLRFVGEVSAVLDASLDPATTLERVPRLLVPFLGDICSVRIARSDGGLELVALAASDTEQEAYARRIEQRHPIDVSGGHPAAEVLRTGRGRLLADIDEDARRAAARDAEHLAALEALGMTSTIVAPLRARGQTLGTLSVGRIGGGRRYDAEDVALVEDLARRAALAYDNARLYEERRRVAATLQASLLPERLPPLPGLELAARYRPATGHGEVGGDFYDAFAADAGGWLLAIGDVCGKGAEAASLTALTRHTIRAAAMAHERPAAIVDVLNEAIRRQVTDGRFCTVVLGHVHVQAQGAAVSLVRAGHPPPLVLRAGGAVEAVTPSGAAPGMLEELGLEEAELRLGPGDALVLYTDGLTDARTDGARLGDDAPERLLTGLAGAGAEAIADGVQRGLAELRAELLDDLALLVLAVPHG